MLPCILISFVASTQPVGEYQLKAVFLYNFAQFVEWPKSEDRNAPFVIGIFGNDPFHSTLDEVVRNEHINARPFEVRRIENIDDVRKCQILFVGASDKRDMSAVLSALKGQPILTVSDAPEFARHGGMIQFVTEDKHIKFLINVDAARTADLTVSSKLLRSASIVSATSN